MSTAVKRRRGSTAQHAAFTGQLAEFTYDTDLKTIRVHDGTLVGGVPLGHEHGVSLRKFGARLNGTTDDTAAVQAALDSGENLLFPKGTALVGDLDITSRTFMRIIGCGPRQSIFKSKVGATNVLHGTGAIAQCVFKGFGIDGDSKAQNGFYYSDTSGGSNFLYQCLFSDLRISGCTRDGLKIKRSFSNRFTNLRLEANLWNQAKVWGGPGDVWDRIDIGDVRATYAGIHSFSGGLFTGINGIYGSNKIGSMVRIGANGDATRDDGQTVFPYLHLLSSNFENFGEIGLEIVGIPVRPVYIDNVSFIADSVGAGLKAISCNLSTGKPMIIGQVTFNSYGATYANSLPVHAGCPIIRHAIWNDASDTATIRNDGVAANYPMVGPEFDSTLFSADIGGAFPSSFLYHKATWKGQHAFEYLAAFRLGNVNVSSDYVLVTSSAAKPTTGTWRKGDLVISTDHAFVEAGGGGSKYVVWAWKRLTDGSAHVLNTDWLELRCLTGN